jgi:hypothetical protein
VSRAFRVIVMVAAIILGVVTALPPATGRAQGVPAPCSKTKCVGSTCQNNQNGWTCWQGYIWVRTSDGTWWGCKQDAPTGGWHSGGSCCVGAQCGSNNCDPEDPDCVPNVE